MFPRVLYIDQENALEVDWFGLGALQVRNRHGLVKRASSRQKMLFLEVVQCFQTRGQPVHPSNPRCARLMAEFVGMINEPPDSARWLTLQKSPAEVARDFADGDQLCISLPARSDVASIAGQETQGLMAQVSAGLGAMPSYLLNDPFVVGVIASHTTRFALQLSNGRCPPAAIRDAMVKALQQCFCDASVSEPEATRALIEHRNHADFKRAEEVVELIVGARFGLPEASNNADVIQTKGQVQAMPSFVREAFGSSESEQVATLLFQRYVLRPILEKYGKLWRQE